MPAERPTFREVQQRMTDWLREPGVGAPPDVEPRRLRIYRELLFNNVRDFVETAYPVLKSLLPEAEWTSLVERFFAEHRARSPFFRDISLAFREWVAAARPDWLAARPWIQELMHFEWMELAADCAEVAAVPPHRPDGDLMTGVPCLRPATWPLVYRWPVHRLSPEHPPADTPPAQPTCLLAYRDDEETLHFLEVSPLSARLVEMMQAGEPRSGRALLQALSREAGVLASDLEAFQENGRQLLEDMRRRGVLPGTCLLPV